MIKKFIQGYKAPKRQGQDSSSGLQVLKCDPSSHIILSPTSLRAIGIIHVVIGPSSLMHTAHIIHTPHTHAHSTHTTHIHKPHTYHMQTTYSHIHKYSHTHNYTHSHSRNWNKLCAEFISTRCDALKVCLLFHFFKMLDVPISLMVLWRVGKPSCRPFAWEMPTPSSPLCVNHRAR